MIDSKHLLNDDQAIDRIFTHIDNGTTDLGDTIWKEPVENYYSLEIIHQNVTTYSIWSTPSRSYPTPV